MPNDQESEKGKKIPPPSPSAQMPSGSGATIYEPAFLEPSAQPSPEAASAEAPAAPEPKPPNIRKIERPPALPEALSNARAIVPKASETMFAPPVLRPPCRTVELRVREMMGTVAQFPWAATRRELGLPVVVNGSLIAVYIAAKIAWISTNPVTGATEVGIELVFVPLGSEELQRDWVRKYGVQKSWELREDLAAAITAVLERVELSVGLVVRFVGGPPMDQRIAQANGYHFWMNETRCPTRVELDRVLATERTERIRELKTTARRFGCIVLAWWWISDPEKYELSQEEDPPPSSTTKVDPRTHQEMLAHAASLAGSVIASLGSIVYARDLATQKALAAKGRGGMAGTQLGGTIMVYPAEPESDDEEDGV